MYSIFTKKAKQWTVILIDSVLRVLRVLAYRAVVLAKCRLHQPLSSGPSLFTQPSYS